LFSTVIHWPEQILSSIESSKDKLNNQKHQADISLMKRCLNTDIQTHTHTTSTFIYIFSTFNSNVVAQSASQLTKNSKTFIYKHIYTHRHGHISYTASIIRFILRIGKLEETMKVLQKDLDIFKMKEKMTLEENNNNVERLNQISISMEAAVKEIEVCV